MNRFVIASVLTTLLPSSTSAQQLELGPRVSVGGGSSLTAHAAIRTNLLWRRWGVYGQLGARASTATCASSLPSSCSLPDSKALEVAAGITGLLPRSPLYFSVGTGLLRWGGGTDPLVEAEVGVRIPLSRSMRLGLGVHALTAPGVERPNVRSVDVSFVEGVVGLTVGLGRP